MAPPRIIDPTGLYHVMSRGNFKQPIFLDNPHFEKYLALLERVVRHRKWIVLDWCLIPNHYHLLVRLQDDGLSEGMRELNGCFSRWSNLQTGRTKTGHLVKNRFLAIDVLREGHLFELLSYIPLNPVRAGLVSRPEAWPWSGYRATIGLEQRRPFHRPNELLRIVGPTRAEAIRRYEAIVREARVRDGRPTWSDQVA
ncbi:MAG TPA: transposase [Gaiellaceae bacterium]|nr:transposase [Gaiellaceae bacterium]